MLDPRAIPDLTRWYEGSKGSHLSGCYYQTSPLTTTSTNNALGVGVLRVAPFFVPRGITITRVGMEVNGAGDTGSVLRLGFYADNGNGLPGNLALDAGTIPGDAVAAFAEVTVSKILRAGLYWVGAVPQGVTTTQPTVRSIAPGTAVHANYVPLTNGSLPTSNMPTNIGYAKTGVTGALPTTWGAGISPTSVAARVIVKVA